MQTQVALSNTCIEAENVSLSQALREVVPVMNLIKELQERKFTTISSVPKVYCKAFEDNSGALELARSPKLRPRTKHINNMYGTIISGSMFKTGRYIFFLSVPNFN